MYSQFFINSKLEFDQAEMNFQKCIIGGNWLMILSLTITLFCITMSFGFNELISLPFQIASHIFTIVFAAFFKLGYVIRCVGVHGLGYKVY